MTTWHILTLFQNPPSPQPTSLFIMSYLIAQVWCLQCHIWCNCSKRCSLLHTYISPRLFLKGTMPSAAVCFTLKLQLCASLWNCSCISCMFGRAWVTLNPNTYVVMTGSAALLVWGPFDCGSWHTCIYTVLLLVHQTPCSNSDFVPFYGHTVPDLNVRRAQLVPI